MKSRAYGLGVPLLVICVLLASACNNRLVRGEFSNEACPGGVERVNVPQEASYAFYYDGEGNLLGNRAEDLKDTANNKMCPTPAESGPGACPSGYCLTPIPGTTMKYCRRCS